MCLTNLSPRTGATLVELTVVIVLLALILGGLLSVTDRQQRLYRVTSTASATRSQVRQAAEILPVELRGLSPTDGDIIQALDSALEFRSTIATGVICERTPDGLALAPLRPGAGALRGELFPPAAGDIAHVLAADPADPARDRWLSRSIDEATGDPYACADGPFVDPVADAGLSRLRLGFSDALPPVARPGAPVRITRPVRYSLYRSSDRAWYLGAEDFAEGRWSGIQPVSGPYAAYGRGQGGIRFEYLDEAGSALDPPVDASRIALIRLSVRPPARAPARGAPSSARLASLTDSAVVDVAIRNRPVR